MASGPGDYNRQKKGVVKDRCFCPHSYPGYSYPVGTPMGEGDVLSPRCPPRPEGHPSVVLTVWGSGGGGVPWELLV